jgi:hypothetical protein
MPKTSILPKMNRFVAIQMAKLRDIHFLKVETLESQHATTTSGNNLTPLGFLDGRAPFVAIDLHTEQS